MKTEQAAVNYHEMLGLLQAYEKDHQLNKGLVNLVEGSLAGAHRLFKKGKKKKSKKVLSAPGPSQTTKKPDKSKA